jgi:hypothetical protein
MYSSICCRLPSSMGDEAVAVVVVAVDVFFLVHVLLLDLL